MSLFAKLNRMPQTEEHEHFSSKLQLLSTFKKAGELPGFVQDYLLSRLALGYSPATIQRYIYDFCFFFSYVKQATGSSEADMSSLTLDDFLQLQKDGIEHYLSYLALEVENEARTINRKLSVLQSLFDYLIKKGKTETNPVLAVKRPKIGKKEPVYLTKEEMRQFFKQLDAELPTGTSERQKRYHQYLKERDFLVIHLLVFTGLRISELASLRLKQVQFERRTILVHGKGNKERTVPLSAETINLIRRYLESLPKKSRPAHGEAPLLVGYDFKTGAYLPGVTVSALQKMLQRQLKKAARSIPSLQTKPISAHKLRHTFATALIEQGVDVLTVQSLLGHETVATTQVYAHVQNKAREKAIEQLSF
ncbi:tyrosine-type recombinase/integrase [Halalkalibacter oceani]|uniref:tyrosine-type recombinase/integrase n=1 Tax=Halalkalibacter oceani TaxID=1653776 RepID=UPI00339291D3